MLGEADRKRIGTAECSAGVSVRTVGDADLCADRPIHGHNAEFGLTISIFFTSFVVGFVAVGVFTGAMAT